jgi:hypothetical protein
MSNEDDVDMKDEMDPKPPAKNGEAREFIGPFMPPLQSRRKGALFGNLVLKPPLGKNWTTSGLSLRSTSGCPRSNTFSRCVSEKDQPNGDLPWYQISRALLPMAWSQLPKTSTPDALGTWTEKFETPAGSRISSRPRGLY